MGSFLDNFQPDPDPAMADVCRIWRTRKPILLQAVVAVAPPYPDYPKLKVSKRRGPSSDPACPSARDASDEIDVILYASIGKGFASGYQEQAWDYLQVNPIPIELALRRKLFAWHTKQMRRHQEEVLPHDATYQKYWKKIESTVPLEEPAAIDHLFKLVAVSLSDGGLDECGFTAYEFQTGWDRDHGLGVLMHRDRVLAAGGMGELIYGPDPAASARAVQSYDLDEGDYELPKT